jgi:putative endonuclease
VYAVYILTNKAGTVLYTGFSANLPARLDAHIAKAVPGFTARYNATLLVYYEAHDDRTAALEREKQIKSWSRRRKIQLIESLNPTWRDLSEQL